MTDKGGMEYPEVRAALVKKYEAEAKQALAEAASTELFASNQAERHALEAEDFNMGLATKRETFKEWQAMDTHAHVYRFIKEVSEESVQKCISALTTWSRTEPGCPITIVFSSPGGSVVPGLALYDFLIELRASGHELTTVVRGYAASMAGILMQAGDVRVIGAESWVLIHEVSGGMMGSYGEMEDRMLWLEKVQGRILDIFAARSAGKKSRAQFERAWKRKDFWLSSDDAIEWGVADKVG